MVFGPRREGTEGLISGGGRPAGEVRGWGYPRVEGRVDRWESGSEGARHGKRIVVATTRGGRGVKRVGELGEMVSECKARKAAYLTA